MFDSKDQDSLDDVDFDSLQKLQEGKNVLIKNVDVRDVTPDTFRISYREVKKPMLTAILQDSFVENQTGGRFLIKQNCQDITVDIKGCNIARSILQ